MAVPSGPFWDRWFVAGFALAVVGGLALLGSALAVGTPLSVLGGVLAVVGFALIGYGATRRPAAPSAARRPRPSRAVAPAPEPTDAPAISDGPESGSPEEGPWAPPSEAPVVEPSPSSFPSMSPLPSPGGAVVGIGSGDPLPAPGPRPAVTLSASTAPAESPGPSEASSSGEILPEDSARSLAMLGLPWEETPAHPPPAAARLEQAPAAEAARTPAAIPPPAASSLIFAPATLRPTAADPFAEEAPASLPDAPDSPRVPPVDRSGAYAGAPGETLSVGFLIPPANVPRPIPPAPPVPLDTRGLVTRVPEPPARGVPAALRCSACGEPSRSGATGENRCWGCGRPVCTDCFWRYGPGPALHRCPSCAAQLGPRASVSGGRLASRPRGPFGTADETDWGEGP